MQESVDREMQIKFCPAAQVLSTVIVNLRRSSQLENISCIPPDVLYIVNRLKSNLKIEFISEPKAEGHTISPAIECAGKCVCVSNNKKLAALVYEMQLSMHKIISHFPLPLSLSDDLFQELECGLSGLRSFFSD